MLNIRNAQLSAFEELEKERFLRSLAVTLQEKHPRACEALGGAPEVRAFARRTVERGREHGIETTGGVTMLAEILLQYGEALERSPVRAWATSILRHPVLPGHAKALALRDRHEEESDGRVMVCF